MSLSLDLKKIKSSGIYRFVYDKSTLPPSEAETIRLFVGYSNKGPFNTPVYVDNTGDFETIFGKASKKLERKGMFFHRLCTEAIPSGPILALNLKPFAEEKVKGLTVNCSALNKTTNDTKDIKVTALYDTNRFWTLDPDSLPSKFTDSHNYLNIATTDTKENSVSIIVRPVPENSDYVKGYDMTFKEWYTATGYEIPDYIANYLMGENLSKYFIEVYVFKGKLSDDGLCGTNGPLNSYFTESNGSYSLNSDYKNAYGDAADALYALADDDNSNFIAGYVGCTLPYFKDANGAYISIDTLINNDQSLHKLICKLDESKLEGTDVTGLDTLKKYIYPELDNADGVSSSESASNTNTPSPIYLEGYTYSNSNVTIENCLSVLKQKGIREALTNHVDSEWHYLVDTFGCTSLTDSGDGTSTHTTANKTLLANIVKAKDNAFGILNFPAMSLFKANNNYNGGNGTALDGKFDISKVASKFSLPNDVNGASWVAYYTPYVVSDGTVKTIVPSAGAISNNFMEKWTTRLPYNGVAGPIYGQVTADGLVGPDYNYSRSDLDVLEPMGVNALVYHPRYGTYINSNQTAKQKPVSALSKINVRELVIYLQDEIENMLRGYQWELNTASLRATIKTKADTLLENVKANGGVYAFENICDDSNNTSEVIDNEMVILDTHIEPARLAGKMVQRLYIYKTGDIKTSAS